MQIIPYSCQDIDDEDISAVVDILKSPMLTQGPTVSAFENLTSEYVGASYAVATNSATSALHIACLALGVSAGDLVWTTAISFVASANCAIYCGADIDFVDINLQTNNMCPFALEQKLEEAQKIGKLPKVIIPVHMCGSPANIKRINELSKIFKFKIIEDASHAFGASISDRKVGNCEFSDITIFSFHPVKMITTGEGGMAVTNDKEAYKALKSLRTHGIVGETNEMLPTPDHEIWNYQQIGLGYNYRLTDIQAALGISQIAKINRFVSIRNSIANNYKENLRSDYFSFQLVPSSNLSSYHLFTIQTTKERQVPLYRELRKKGILVNLHYIPIYRHPFYERLGFKQGYCPNAEEYFQKILSIPISTKLTESQQSYIIKILNSTQT